MVLDLTQRQASYISVAFDLAETVVPMAHPFFSRRRLRFWFNRSPEQLQACLTGAAHGEKTKKAAEKPKRLKYIETGTPAPVEPARDVMKEIDGDLGKSTTTESRTL